MSETTDGGAFPRTECGIVDGFTVRELADGSDYRGLLRRFLAGGVEPERRFGAGDKWGAIFSWEGRRFVLKYNAQPIKYWENKASRLVRGPVFSRIMRKSNEAIARGCDIIQRVYLVAERMERGLARESYMLTEYIPGESLEGEAANLPAAEIVATLQRLHEYKLALIDPHPGNFIRTDNGLKIIDLTFRDGFLMGRAKDIVMSRRYMGIDVPATGLVSRFMVCVVRANQYLRNLSRRLRGHPRAYVE